MFYNKNLYNLESIEIEFRRYISEFKGIRYIKQKKNLITDLEQYLF